MGGGPRRVDEAYADVHQNVEASVAQLQAEEAALNDRLADVNEQLAALQQEAATIADALAKVAAGLAATQESRGSATYEALFAALASQSEAIGARATKARSAEVALDKDLLAGLVDDPERAEVLQQYLQYIKQIAPGLNAFPEDYRREIQAKHAEVTQTLYRYFEKTGPHYADLSEEELTVDVVAAVDELSESEVVVTMVIPVTNEVQLKWADRQDGLSTCVAARCIEGAYKAVFGLGHPNAQVVFGGHRGLLVAEIQLEADPNEVGPAIIGAVQAALDRAPELQAAKLVGRIRVVDIDELMPEELFDAEVEDAG